MRLSRFEHRRVHARGHEGARGLVRRKSKESRARALPPFPRFHTRADAPHVFGSQLHRKPAAASGGRYTQRAPMLFMLNGFVRTSSSCGERDGGGDESPHVLISLIGSLFVLRRDVARRNFPDHVARVRCVGERGRAFGRACSLLLPGAVDSGDALDCVPPAARSAGDVFLVWMFSSMLMLRGALSACAAEPLRS